MRLRGDRGCGVALWLVLRDASSGKLFTRTIAKAMLLIEGGAALHNLVLAVIWNSHKVTQIARHNEVEKQSAPLRG